jgi:hypothetical protein
VGNTIFGGGREQEIIFAGLKGPRECTLVLLVEVMYMVGINFFI